MNSHLTYWVNSFVGWGHKYWICEDVVTTPIILQLKKSQVKMSLSPFDRVASVLWQSTSALGSSWSDLRRRFLSMFPQHVSPHYPLLVHFITVLCFPHMSHHTIHYWCTKMQHLITLLCSPQHISPHFQLLKHYAELFNHTLFPGP